MIYVSYNQHICFWNLKRGIYQYPPFGPPPCLPKSEKLLFKMGYLFKSVRNSTFEEGVRLCPNNILDPPPPPKIV